MRYSIELMRTVNKRTGAKRYFKQVCNAMRRRSLAESDYIYDLAFGFHNLLTTSTPAVWRHYTGCTYYARLTA